MPLDETIHGFEALLEGAGDDYSEAAFYMTGNIEAAFEQGKKLALELGEDA